MHGGLLCDEMCVSRGVELCGHRVAVQDASKHSRHSLGRGLGKTVELVALILSTLDLPAPAAVDGTIPSKATLIIVPPTLVSQWMAEIRKSVGANSTLKYSKYTAEDIIRRDNHRGWVRAATSLAAHDIVRVHVRVWTCVSVRVCA